MDAAAVQAPNGGSLLGQGGRREAAQLIAGAMHSLDVALVQPGPWQVECRTANHQVAGMVSTIDVAPNGAQRAAAPAPEQSCAIAITSNSAFDASPSFWIVARQVRASHTCKVHAYSFTCCVVETAAVKVPKQPPAHLCIPLSQRGCVQSPCECIVSGTDGMRRC